MGHNLRKIKKQIWSWVTIWPITRWFFDILHAKLVRIPNNSWFARIIRDSCEYRILRIPDAWKRTNTEYMFFCAWSLFAITNTRCRKCDEYRTFGIRYSFLSLLLINNFPSISNNTFGADACLRNGRLRALLKWFLGLESQRWSRMLCCVCRRPRTISSLELICQLMEAWG